jgi:ABC-type glutathione transport system ATPase component
MAFWIQDIRDDLGITVLMVEHDMSLVSRVSDRVLAMNQGEVLATGTPAEVQAHPGVDRGLPRHRRRRQLAAEGRPVSAEPVAVDDRSQAEVILRLLQRRERLRPDQGHPRRQPGGASGRDRHRAGQQRRRQDDHPEDHLRHHRPAPRAASSSPARTSPRSTRR